MNDSTKFLTTMDKAWQDKINQDGENYFSKAREEYIRQGKDAKKSKARYALEFAERNRARLAELDIVDLSAVLEDLDGAFLYDRQEERKDMVRNLCSMAQDRLVAEKQPEKLPGREVEAYLAMLEIYRKRINRRVADDVFKVERRLRIAQTRASQTMPEEKVLPVAINQAQPAAEFAHLDIEAINAAAAEHFNQAKQFAGNSDEYKQARKKGNLLIREACGKYIQEHIGCDEDWNKLSTRELVYLHRNLRFRPQEFPVAKLAAMCMQRLKNAEAMVDGGKYLEPEDVSALKEFCRYSLNDIKDPHNENQLLEAGYYKGALRRLDRAIRPQPEEQTATIEAVSETHPGSLAAKFEEACQEGQIRIAKQPNSGTAEYNLYPPKADENAQPNGKLTIAVENEVTLQSEEQAHFRALVKAIKESGHNQIVLDKLSPNPEEAKKFAAQMLLAGIENKVRVKTPFKTAELAEIDHMLATKLKQLKLERAKQDYRQEQTQAKPGNSGLNPAILVAAKQAQK